MTQQLRLYNTQTRQKEPVYAQDGQKIRIYTCGPTVYDFAHIGNFRTYVAEDLLRRVLQFFEHSVFQVMNITDVDDKTIRMAIQKQLPLREAVAPFQKAFFEDLATLRIERAEKYPQATDYIPQMVEKIQTLIDKGFAYVGADQSVYFSIRKSPSYGKLSHFCLKDLKINASGENPSDEYTKEEVCDFVLWKAYDSSRDGDIYWESPWGPGRPGWHMECSTMALDLLGHTLDLHCGGVDNLFPHHENEIAQSEALCDQTFVRHWFHVEHLLVEHKKMSKSLQNFYTLRDLLAQGYTGQEVRYLLLSTHYRTQLNFTFAGLEAARSSLRRLSDLIRRLKDCEEASCVTPSDCLDRAQRAFEGALADDLNLSLALAALFDLVRDVNTLADEKRLSVSFAKQALGVLSQWNRVLGVLPLEEDEEVPHHLQLLLSQREEARKGKEYSRSDHLRDEIFRAGYLIEDTPKGSRLKKITPI